MMSEEVRSLIQSVTLIMAIASIIMFVALVGLRVLAWRFVLVPSIVMFEIAAFYMVLVVIGPFYGFSIGPYANFISAVIRFQSVSVVTSYLSYALYKYIKQYIKQRGISWFQRS